MEKIPLLIIGSSGHAKVIIDIIERQDKYEILGLIDSYRLNDENTLGYKILGDESIIIKYASEFQNLHLFVAIGDNAVRFKIVNKINSFGKPFFFATLIHPLAVIGKNVKIGIGVAVMAGVVVNTDSVIGDFSIINTTCSIDHDCLINEFVTVAPGAVLGGSVKVGRFAVISIGATVIHGINIGEDAIVGAGATVIGHINNNEIYVGVPAKKLRSRNHGEKYL
jgi:sugar O-acyltransferase (sialic acid O-acetyltransferase NeuD family)